MTGTEVRGLLHPFLLLLLLERAGHGYDLIERLTGLGIPDVEPSHAYRVLRSLERHAIEARPVWKPMHLQPLYRDAPYFAHAPGEDVCAQLFAAGLCLPSGSNLEPQQIERVIDQLRRALLRAEALGATPAV